jgi:hypothetical protein
MNTPVSIIMVRVSMFQVAKRVTPTVISGLIGVHCRDPKMTERYKNFLANSGEILRSIETHRHDGFESALATAKSIMADAALSGDLVVLKSGLNAFNAVEKKLALLPDESRQRFCSSMCRAFTPSAKLLGMMPSPDPAVVRGFIQSIIDQATHPFDEIADLPTVVSKIPVDYELLATLLLFLIKKSASVEEAIRFHMGYPECIGDLIQNVVRSPEWPRPRAGQGMMFSEQQMFFLNVVAENITSLLTMAESHNNSLLNVEKLSSLWGILVRDVALLFGLVAAGFSSAAEYLYHQSAHWIYWRYVKDLAETGFMPTPRLVAKNLKNSLSSVSSKYWSTTLRFHFFSHGALTLPEGFFSEVYGEDVCKVINELCVASTVEDVGVCQGVIEQYMRAQAKYEAIFSPELPAFILEARPDLA